jgi:opacity protein-like surface antigen
MVKKITLPVFTFIQINGMLLTMKKMSAVLIFLLLSSIIFPKSVFKVGPYTGYFSPADKTLKDIYKGEDIIYGLKLGVRAWKGLYIWLSGMQFKKTAETTLLGDKTTLTLNPINLSLRCTFELGTINPYLQGGYSYIFYKEESDIGDVKGEGKGYCLDAGIEFKISPRFIIDVGARYSRATVRPTGFDVQLGGAQAGVSFLVAF